MQGSVLKVVPGTWSPVPESFSYQWARCTRAGRVCAPIKGETAETHAVGAGDLGRALVAIVQARSGTTSQAVFSVATGAVVAGAEDVAGPLSSAPPLIAVVVQQGRQLTGAVGSWSGSGAITYAYQWYRCNTAGAHCTSVHGATSRTYTLVAKDVGKTLGFTVRATDKTGTANAYASLVGPVAGPTAKLVSTGQPAITGAPKEGQTLQVSAGSWSPTPATVGYQWQRCNANGRLCIPLPGATASAYTLTAADTGHALVAVVRATVGATSQDALSLATPAVVTAQTTGPSSSATPAVAGTSQQGKQLTGSTGHWSGSGAIGYAYQWYRCDAAGAHCTSIHGVDEADLHARRQGRRPDARIRRPRHRRHGHRHGLRESRRPGRREPTPHSCRRRNRGSRAWPGRARRSRSPAAAGTRRLPPSPTCGSAATRTAASAPRSQARRPPPTPPRPPTPAMRWSHSSRPKRTASRSATLSTATATVS